MAGDPFSEHYLVTLKKHMRAYCLLCKWKGRKYPNDPGFVFNMETMIEEHLYRDHQIGDHLTPVREKLRAAWEKETAWAKDRRKTTCTTSRASGSRSRKRKPRKR